MTLTKYLALSAIVLACSLACAAEADPLVLDRRVVQLDNDATTFLGISLKKAPTRGDKVAVFFEGESVYFDKCSLEFTSENIEQKVGIVAETFLTPAEMARKFVIKAQLFADSVVYSNNNQVMNITTQRSEGKAGLCKVDGDPQFQTFDQNGYNFKYQGKGTHQLVKSEKGLTIQVTQDSCGSSWGIFGWLGGTKVTCVYGIAVRYGNTVYAIDATTLDNQKAVKLMTPEDKTGMRVDVGSDGWSILVSDGSRIDLNAMPWSGTRYMNVDVHLASHHKTKVAGLCGTWDDNPRNDYTTPDKKTFEPDSSMNGGSNADKYGNTWRVSDDQNLFEKGIGATGLGSVQQKTAPLIKCTIPQLSPSDAARIQEHRQQLDGRNPGRVGVAGSMDETAGVVGQVNTTVTTTKTVESTTSIKITIPNAKPMQPILPGYGPVTAEVVTKSVTINTVSVTTMNSTISPQMAPTREQVQKAQEECARRITAVSLCEKYDKVANYVRGCEYDIGQGMYPETIYASYSRSYARRCTGILSSLARDTAQTVAAAARTAAKAACMGTLQCDDQCAQCTIYGCLVCKDQEKYEVRAGRCQPRPMQLSVNMTVFAAIAPKPQPVFVVPSPAPLMPSFNVMGINGLVTKPVQPVQTRVVIKYLVASNARGSSPSAVGNSAQLPAGSQQEPMQQPNGATELPSPNPMSSTPSGTASPAHSNAGDYPVVPSQSPSSPSSNSVLPQMGGGSSPNMGDSGYGTAQPSSATDGVSAPRRHCVPRHHSSFNSAPASQSDGPSAPKPSSGTGYDTKPPGDASKISSYDTNALAALSSATPRWSSSAAGPMAAAAAAAVVALVL